MKPYPLAEDLLQPVLRVAMPRAPRLVAPGCTVHVVARCNNREFSFLTPEDFEVLLAHLREMVRTYEVKVYAYMLMANHMHLLLQAPTANDLGSPLRWIMTETAKAFHKARGRRGHFWERRYRAVVVEDDLYALAALRYLDLNPVRAGLVEDPTTYPWSSCAAYARGDANPLITLHPSYLGLSPYPMVRQRQYRALLAPSPDPQADARDPRWTTQRAVGTATFVARYTPRLGRRRIVSVPPQIQALGE
jgi:REP-associated tyrosine transposase